MGETIIDEKIGQAAARFKDINASLVALNQKLHEAMARPDSHKEILTCQTGKRIGNKTIDISETIPGESKKSLRSLAVFPRSPFAIWLFGEGLTVQ